MNTQKKQILITLLASCALLASLLLAPRLYQQWQTESVEVPVPCRETIVPRPVILNVFIHGSFGTTLGLLSAFDVLHDAIRGTRYHKVTKKMRKNLFYFKDQPILQRGLVALQPTLDPQAINGNKLAAFPLIKVFDEVQKQFFSDTDTHRYYTFGWTGLLGQKPRRFESIRLYNALSQEVARLRADNFEPRIRIYSHSHGGNLSLNLNLINQALALGKTGQVPGTIRHAHQREALAEMLTLLKSFDTREKAETREGQKLLDYYPENNDVYVERLVMFGCPLQPETDHCIMGSTFGKVYSFYSDQDMIQRLDLISTKQSYSKQRLERKDLQLLTDNRFVYNKNEKLIQAKIMVGRDLSPSGHLLPTKDTSNFWEQVLSDVGVLSKRTKDPTHKEFWFAQWHKKQADTSLNPLPAFVLAPMMLYLLDQSHVPADADIHVAIDHYTVHVSAFEHDTPQTITSCQLNKSWFNDLIDKFIAFKPKKVSVESEFEIINDYHAAPETAEPLKA